MKALTRLQSTVMFQAAAEDNIASKFSQRAKTMVAFGTLVAAALASQNAHAQSQVLTPSNCAVVGATVGGLVGSQSTNSGTKNAVFAALGALGGGAAGHWLCSPRVQSQDSSYANAARYGLGDSSSVEVARQAPKQPLSISERDALDDLSRQALDAKYNWKLSLYKVDQVKNSGYSAGLNTAVENEAAARSAFETKRDVFARTVARLNAGADGTAPRAVGRYLEVSGSLLELSTQSRVSYQMLEERDQMLQQRSTAYKDEANRAGAMRARNT